MALRGQMGLPVPAGERLMNWSSCYGGSAQICLYAQRPAGEHQQLPDVLIHPQVRPSNGAPGNKDQVVAAQHEIGRGRHFGQVRSAA